MATITSPPSLPPEADGPVDAARLDSAKDLLHTLANAVSAMKIFPSEHATVGNFVDLLSQKLASFLAAYKKLQVGIEEYAFTVDSKPVYTDEVATKSLPFFFFKDGLLILYFYQGLTRAEVLEFLEMIKAEAQKPADSCDIVAALWERDFPNIQYYAPEEYLENRIMAERRDSLDRKDLPDLPAELASETIEVRVDTSKFTEGRIELAADDLETVSEQRARDEAAPAPEDVPGPGIGPGPTAAPGPAGEEAGSRSPAAAMDPTLTDSELRSLETMVRTNRTISPEEEYIDLMVEIVYLEEDPAGCQASLDALLEYHFDQLEQGHFHIPVLVIQKVHELRRHLDEKPDKSRRLEEFLRRTISPKTIEAVKSLLDKKRSLDWESLLGFFGLLGPASVGLAADLHEIAPTGEARHRVLAFVESVGASEPKLLADIISHERTALAREIVGMLARVPGSRGVPHLAAFLTFPDREIKLEAIHTLGGLRDEVAGRILLGFLKDQDEEVRIQAALKLDPSEAGARVRQIVREAAGKEFRAKSLKEKEAILSFLGRTRTEEALGFLSATLLRAPLFPSKQALEMRLAAAAGLAVMGTEGALSALQKGVIGRTKKVREACRTALERLPPAARLGS